CICFLIVESFFNGLRGLNFHPVDHVMRLHGPTGLFAHPNSLGGVTAGVLPFLYYLFFYERRIWRKILIIVIALMAARVIIWTGSRTAWVGTLALMGFIWWYSRRKIVLALCGVVLLVTAWVAMPPVMKARFITLGETVKVVEGKEQVSSMSTRWQLMKDEWGVFLKYPLTGVGINSFPQARLRIYGRWQPHHNTYLQALADLGIIGFAAFAYLIYTIWSNLRQAAARGDPEHDDPFITTMTLTLWVFLLTRLTVGMFGGDLYENYWWIAGGLSIVLLNIAREQSAESDAGDQPEEPVQTNEPATKKPKRPRWKSTVVQ
ncbi:MAG: O-antigen ligase family protein, partial [Candidatus Hydrogenedentes bacterium]|nr:O-antigen ligase family protein [Candidatus Hydrogenedentota bacterium]